MRAKIVNNDDLVDDDGISDVMEWVGTGTAVGRSAGGKVDLVQQTLTYRIDGFLVDSAVFADVRCDVGLTVGSNVGSSVGSDVGMSVGTEVGFVD